MTFTLATYGLAALLSGLISGVFMSFSDFVMRSLRMTDGPSGIAAMQSINRRVYRSVFIVWLLGMAPVSIGLAVYAWFQIEGPAASWFIAGGLIYLTGVFGVTILGNVPMNKRLDVMTPTSTATAAYWEVYLTWWTLWNHVRTAAAGIAAAAFLIGCAVLA